MLNIRGIMASKQHRISYLDFILKERSHPEHGGHEWLVHHRNSNHLDHYTPPPVGRVMWYPAWGRYVYQSLSDALTDSGHLKSIARFCGEKTRQFNDQQRGLL
jgi:hypothetical protein